VFPDLYKGWHPESA